MTDLGLYFRLTTSRGSEDRVVGNSLVFVYSLSVAIEDVETGILDGIATEVNGDAGQGQCIASGCRK